MSPRISHGTSQPKYNIRKGEADQKQDILTRRERHVPRSKAQLWYKEGKYASGARCTSRSVCLGRGAALWFFDPSAPTNSKLSGVFSKTQEWLFWYYWPKLPPQYTVCFHLVGRKIFTEKLWNLVKPRSVRIVILLCIYIPHMDTYSVLNAYICRYMMLRVACFYCRCFLGDALKAHGLAGIRVSRYRRSRHIRS